MAEDLPNQGPGANSFRSAATHWWVARLQARTCLTGSTPRWISMLEVVPLALSLVGFARSFEYNWCWYDRMASTLFPVQSVSCSSNSTARTLPLVVTLVGQILHVVYAFHRSCSIPPGVSIRPQRQGVIPDSRSQAHIFLIPTGPVFLPAQSHLTGTPSLCPWSIRWAMWSRLCELRLAGVSWIPLSRQRRKIRGLGLPGPYNEMIYGVPATGAPTADKCTC